MPPLVMFDVARLGLPSDDRIYSVLLAMDARGAMVARSTFHVVGISLGGCADALGTERVGAMRRFLLAAIVLLALVALLWLLGPYWQPSRGL